MPNIIDIFVIAILVTAFFGLTLGYKRGRQYGKLEGEIGTGLKLREQSLIIGRCVLCGTKEEHGKTQSITE